MVIKVSVIIPVYNVERTLHRCVDSIINQTMKDIEIILVDDGSQDNSSNICDEYSNLYENIFVIHKENEGLGPTRNVGSNLARGEYIYHCDSDDWVEPTMLEEVYENAKKNDAEAVIFGYRLLCEDGKNLENYGVVSGQDEEYTGKEIIQEFFIRNLKNAYFTQSACNRFIKKEFLERYQLEFKPFRRSQDVIFSLDLFDELEKLNVMSNVYYNYIIEPGKFKGRSFAEMISIYLDVYEEIYKRFAKWNKLDDKVELLILNLYISKISNYASFYTIRKASNKIGAVNELINDKKIQTLFKSIKPNDISSRFIRMTRYAITNKKRLFLLSIFFFHQAKQMVSK